MPRQQWKVAEERLARFFGTDRRPLSGLVKYQGRDDALHPKLFLESKYAQSIPLFRLYRTTRDKAKLENRTPVIGLQERHQRGILLCIHSSDLQTVIEQWIDTKGLKLVKK